MSTRFHKLRIRDLRHETPDCLSISFEIPNHLKDTFTFLPGQNLVLRTRLEGEELRRNYSICSSPLDGECRIAVKKLPGGRFSSWIHEQLKPGDEMEVLPPSGRFCPSLPTTGSRSYAAFAAGSGITPVISIISNTLATNPDSRFLLVYGNRDRRHIIFREALEALKNRYMQRLQVLHILSRETIDTDLHSGRIDASKCEAINKSVLPIASVDDVFLCGPAGMVEAVTYWLQQKGLTHAQIHTERFHIPGIERVQHQTAEALVKDASCQVTLRLDGVQSSFEAHPQAETLLDAAIRHGIDLPFACKGGMCGTCRARLVSGQVRMEQNYALEAEELRQGYILTCQSQACSPEVAIDFDAR